MADYKKPTSSFLSSNKLLTNFIPKSFTDSESMSPTSILDFKTTPKQELKNPTGPSLGLIEALIDTTPGPNPTKPGSGTVLFGPQLKIQVPPLFSPVFPPSESPNSHSDFGTKSNLGPFSPPNLGKSSFGSSSGLSSGMSVSEMELSEDYTCVISYGPNPKTTHIFDDCVVESCCGVVRLSEPKKNVDFAVPSMGGYHSENFLSCCYGCKKSLEQGCDIYMYRGEKAFCSDECRCKEMMAEDEEWIEASDMDEA